MKVKSKIISLLLALALVLVFAMAACGGGGKTEGGGDDKKTVSSIDITTEPTKKEYLVGDTLDLTGGVLAVYYSDGSSGTVQMTDSGVSATADMNVAGSNVTVTVTYSGKSDTYRISVAEPVVTYTVTFNYNYTGAPEPTVKEVEGGQSVTPPADPDRTDYRFAGWYTDATEGEAYAFGPVTENITLYAHWADANSVTLTMKWNMAGQQENFAVQSYERGAMTPSAGDLPEPSLAGYRFMGWYTDTELTQEYSRMFINADTVLYAKWLKEYVFEAEQTDIADIDGAGYSNSRGGDALIFESDDGQGPDMKASGGYYIAGLYTTGAELVFTINAQEAVDDAVLVLRLAAEFRNITMSSDPTAEDYYTISVNGNAIQYSNISLTGTDIPDPMDGGRYPFEDYTITTSLSLQKGENVIRLVTSNANAYHVGTQKANAPMVDCIKIYTDTELTWTPVDNIKD